MTWVRPPEILKAHDKAIPYIMNWWEENVGRALTPNVTGDQYGIDLYNDVENVHVNYRTKSGKWGTGPFPYDSLRELFHKVKKLKELKTSTGKQTYVVHVSTDYRRFIIAEIDNFSLDDNDRVSMPSETSKDGKVDRMICYSKIWNEHLLSSKKFGSLTLSTKKTTPTKLMLSDFM